MKLSRMRTELQYGNICILSLQVCWNRWFASSAHSQQSEFQDLTLLNEWKSYELFLKLIPSIFCCTVLNFKWKSYYFWENIKKRKNIAQVTSVNRNQFLSIKICARQLDLWCFLTFSIKDTHSVSQHVRYTVSFLFQGFHDYISAYSSITIFFVQEILKIFPS